MVFMVSTVKSAVVKDIAVLIDLRAPAIATGVKIAKPDLSVWVVTGDGDALSIGGNHLVHVLRRNLDINIVLLNNRIYGLTKGQYSPTSEFGKLTKSSPDGSADQALNVVLLALGSQATYVARALDVDAKAVADVLRQAVEHRGASFIEIYQNCNIFNDGAFDYVRERDTRADTSVMLEHGKPLIFGKERDKGLKLSDIGAEVVNFEAGNESEAFEAGVTTFDKRNATHATVLARMPSPPHFPVPFGVFYKEDRPALEDTLSRQRGKAKEKKPPHADSVKNLQELFHSGETWEIA